MTTTVTLYSLSYREAKTYLAVAAFCLGNIIMPQLAHLVPQGGFIFLPIYFFTLIAAFKYGWCVGLLTAVLSPLVNHSLFGMPPMAVLPIILTKSVLLALIAAFAARRLQRVSVFVLAAVVLGYQVIGGLVEWALTADFHKAAQDFRLGVPGMLLQIFGGCAIINYLMRK